MRIVYGLDDRQRRTRLFDYIQDDIKTVREYPESVRDKVVIILPNHITADAERDVIRRFGNRSASRIKVVSLKVLANIVINEIGYDTGILFGSTGRNALVAKAIREMTPLLKYYNDSCITSSFVKLVSDLISDFKSCGISSDIFLQIAEREDNQKIKDLALFFSTYENLVGNGKLDDADLFRISCGLIRKNRYFSGTKIYFDSYRYFRPSELMFLSELVSSGASITVSLPIPSVRIPSYSLFGATGANLDAIKNICSDLLDDIEYVETEPEKKCPEFDFIRNNYMRASNAVYSDEVKHIDLYRASDTVDEVTRVANKITCLVRDFDYHYNDFLIVHRNPDLYDAVIEPVFRQFGIPVFSHKRVPVRVKSVVSFVESAFSLVLNGMTNENIIRFTKNGYLPDTEEDISLFENYLNMWYNGDVPITRPFVKSVFGMASKKNDEDILNRINSVRQHVLEIISIFRKDLNTDRLTVRDACTAVYDLLDNVHAEKRISEISRHFYNMGEMTLYEEENSLWKTIMDILDELVLVSGDDVISVSMFRDILFFAFDSADIGRIPTSLDQVLAGDAATVPMSGRKVTFVLGLNEGVFPKVDASFSLLTEEDRIMLEKNDLSMSNGIDDILYERYLVYCAATSPSDLLFLSYTSASSRSSAVIEFAELFDHLTEQTSASAIDVKGLADMIQAEKPSFVLYSRYHIAELEDYYKNTDYCRFMYDDISQALSPDVATALYGKDISVSATKVAQFSKCPFSYFMTYGLAISPEQKVSVGRPEQGNYIHDVLRNAIHAYETDPDTDMYKLINDQTENFLENVFKDEIPESFRSYFSILKTSVYSLVERVRTEIDHSDFKPVAYELDINDSGSVSPVRFELHDGCIHMTGKTDRVDLYSDENGDSFIRIIDYKSGSHEFKYSNVFNGLDVQLFVYLFSIISNASELFGKKIEAAECSFLQTSVKPKELARSSAFNDFLSGESASVNSHSGVFIDDDRIISALDNTPNHIYIDKKNLIRKEDFDCIYSRIKKVLIEMGNDLHSGNIAKYPVNEDACKYCSFKKFCERVKGYRNVRNHISIEDFREEK